jgi:RNA polymerase sigma factor (TIGR02999 family)
MNDVADLIQRAAEGEPEALQELFSSVYPELKQLARRQLLGEHPTLTPTALVNELYLKFFGSGGLSVQSQRHFFACAARAMRHLVIDHLRSAHTRARRDSADAPAVEILALDESLLPAQLLEVDSALDALDEINPRQREVVELRFFAGLSIPEMAAMLDCSERTIAREWDRARAFLHAQLGGEAA